MPEKNRFPAVLQPIGLDEEQNASINLFGTLKARTEGGGFEGTVLQPSLYESHPNDSRVTGPVEQCPTVSARWGTGGNNTPLVTDGTLPLAYDDRNQAVSTDTHHTLRGEAAGSRVSDAIVQPDSDGVISFQSKLSFSSASKDVAPTMSTVDVLATTQPGEASAFSWQSGADMRGMVPRPTAQLQQCIGFDSTGSTADAGIEIHPVLRGVTVGNAGHHTGVAQPGEASAFSWQCRGDMRGMVPRPTAQLQRCQIEAVMVQPVAHTLRGEGFDAGEDGTGRGTPIVPVKTPAMHVRRLTPVECERLQGFPDGWTDIRPNGKDTPDSPRYKALGNSMAVPVMRWIGMRIAGASGG